MPRIRLNRTELYWANKRLRYDLEETRKWVVRLETEKRDLEFLLDHSKFLLRSSQEQLAEKDRLLCEK